MQGGSLDINVYDDAVIPDPRAVPEGYLHIIGSGTVDIRTSAPLEKPITVKIPYTKEELEGGDGLIIGDLHEYVPPPLDEPSLRIFKHIARPFGVVSEIQPHWELVENSKVDSATDKVTFETKETGIFGISGMEGKYKALSTQGFSSEQKFTVAVLAVLAVTAVGGVVVYRKRKK